MRPDRILGSEGQVWSFLSNRSTSLESKAQPCIRRLRRSSVMSLVRLLGLILSTKLLQSMNTR